MARAGRQARPAPSRSRGGFLLGLFAGLFVGLAIALGIAFYLNKTPIPFLGGKAKSAARDEAAKSPAVAGMPQSGAPGAAKGDKPKFDFYRILPGGEETISEKELKDAAKAAKSKMEAATKAEPKAIYYIQAGSFQNPADADNQKAKLALLGLEAAVEPIGLPDKGTWYRVRLGPYARIDELNRVRQSLTQNGIEASLVRLKDPSTKDN